MGMKARKVIKYIVLSVLSLAILLAVLNFFLISHLERYLEKELIERTARATDGFYRLSFDKLSISFFNGELKVRGIALRPDPDVFHRWETVDSLPQVYVNTRIGVIDFKGLNLTWRWNYRQLHFNSFEIKSPEVQVFQTLSAGRVKEETKHPAAKTLYEVISPYINAISVKKLNLENASITYNVEGLVSPIVYSLSDVSFHAYGFKLDSTSYRAGKLLYCENFDFVTNQPQTLLTNNDFSLTTDSIRLSTEDSMIFIRDIKLVPQEALWNKTNQKPANYLEGGIGAVDVKGIRFDRKEALNYLTARSFDILSSRINVYSLADKGGTSQTPAQIKQGLANADSLVQSLSLYDVISPVLHSISIDEINIEQAGLAYSSKLKSKTEVYTIPEFNLHAKGFLIDSMIGAGRELRYFQSIDFEAKDIQGILAARNHRLDIKRFALNTATGSFRMDSLRLKPLSTRSGNDYMSGSIDTIRVEGLAYDQGIRSDLLLIRSPRLRYYRMSNDTLPTNKANRESVNSHVDVESLLNPFFRYLSIRKISVHEADATWIDRSLRDTAIYRLKGFNFFASNFLVDEQTSRMNRLFFGCDDFGFSFRDFENDLPGKNYHLSVKQGRLSTVDSVFRLDRVKLTSMKENLTVTIPRIAVTGIRLPQKKFQKQIVVGDLHVDRPAFDWESPDNRKLSASMDGLNVRGLSYDSLSRVLFKNLWVTKGKVAYSWKPGRSLLRTESQGDIYLAVEDAWFNLKDKDFEFGDIQLRTHDLQIPLDNGFYLLKVGNLDLAKSDLRLDSVRLVSPYPKMEFAYKQPKHQDWFDVKVGQVMLTDIDWQSYWDDNRVHIGGLWISDVLLQNLKNRKIPVRPHIVPMIYSGLQKAPVRFRVDTASVSDFSVIYEELPVKGEKPGKLYFKDMNGRFSGLTNIVSSRDQYITLQADGKLMGSGDFQATWKLPVDSLNDRFLLEGRLDSLDLLTLNEIVTPLAPAEIQSGHTHDVSFFMDANSKSGRIQLSFPYRNLKVAILKEKNGELVQKGFLSRLANLVLRHDNPSHPEKPGSKLRQVDINVIRDPYHSTFNYLWQLLKPALVESVGVSKKEQDTVQKAAGFFSKVKHFFGFGKKEKELSTEEPDFESLNP